MTAKSRRAFQSVGLIVASAGVLLDPLTWRQDASDVVVQAPIIQTSFALVSIVLLVVALIYQWRFDERTAAKAVLAEIVVLASWNAALVHVHGVTRFVRGFGAEEYLSWFLLLLALRVVVLYSMMLVAPSPVNAPHRGVLTTEVVS